MNILTENYKLYLGNCLDIMKNIPDKSIDMILCDLPYNITACVWDTIIPFTELWNEYKRVTKSSSNIVLFGSQPFTSELVLSNKEWFSHSWIWEKEQGTNFLLANKMPLKIHEDICVFRKPNNYGINEFIELRNIFKDIFIKINKKKKDIMKDLGQGLDHCFRFNSSQWSLPTKENYEKMIQWYNIQNVPTYEYLKEKYEDEFFRIYNPQETQGKPYISGKGTSGDVTSNVNKIQTVNNGTRKPVSILKFNRETGFHPTQKTVDLLEYLIKTYTNENMIVLDNCMGSGSTGVACLNTNRKFIGIELDENYFDIAVNRIFENYNR